MALGWGQIMRIHLAMAILLAGSAAPATAQRDPVEQRIERLEQQLRAVQRRVFPGGAGAQVEPEIPAAGQPAVRPAPSGSAVADLNARVDSLESQLAALTGLIEENGNRTRQLEEALNRLREDSAARLTRLETPPPVETAPQVETARPDIPPAMRREPGPAPAGDAPAATTDSAEEAYNAGFRLWEARRYEEAQTALQAVAANHPRSRWASWANNLAGRAFLDDGKPATAARIFLANYQNNREGERAADSLYFLGQALVRLDRHSEACRVYDELAEVYPNMRDYLRQRLPAARREARCAS